MKLLLRKCAVVLLLGSFWTGATAQTQPPKKKPAAKPQIGQKSSTSKKSADTKTAAKPKPKPSATPKPDPAAEKEKFDAAIAVAIPSEKAVALIKFLSAYPKSEYAMKAKESLAGARAAMADEKLTGGETEEGIRLFKLVVNDAPRPYSERLFTEIVSTIPGNLFWRGQQTAAIELAHAIETNVSTDQKQLLAVGNFYLRTENGAEAKRIAEAAIKLDETNSAGYQLLGMAHRLNFDLEGAESSYARAVELDTNSANAKRMLAEMKRALGKKDEALVIYTELVAKDENDTAARTGLVLSLFDSGKKAEAETELSKALEQKPDNIVLLAGAAYWYAANGNGDKAVELARSAIEKEPRYVWSHIALARGLILQKRPVEAERVLVSARKYGNFPTLQYEIASARIAAGFYREAGEELSKSFSIDADGVHTRLGGRVERSAINFTDLIANERKAGIFEASAADTSAESETLKALVELEQIAGSAKPDQANAVAAAERFVAGSDEMAVHRKLFAAKVLLDKKIGAEKALEYARSATAGVDTALSVANPNSAVMASELYDARETAFSRNDFLIIPDVPKQTLSAILRGRIEETTGLAMLQMGNAADATVRFRRALSVLPKDSAWWRSATWNLGSSLAAEGKDDEALQTYISSYRIDKPDLSRYITISSLYKKIKGNTEGLEDQIGPSPTGGIVAANVEPTSDKQAEPQPAASPSPKAEDTTTASSSPTPETAVVAVPSPSPAAEVKAVVEPSPSPSPKVEEPAMISESPAPEASPSPEPSPSVTPDVKMAVEPSPSPSITKESVPVSVRALSPSPEPTVEAKAVTEMPASASEEKPKTESAQSPISSPSPKPLFEPVVITIPSSGKKPAATTGSEQKNPDQATVEKSVDEKKIEEPAKEKPAEEKPASAEAIADGSSRPRVVAGKEITGGEMQPCTIEISQDSVSLINNGGSIALLLSVAENADIKEMSALSNSIKDIEVRPEPEIAGVPNRALYVVKSISQNTGLYQATFELPCGKKVLNIRVR